MPQQEIDDAEQEAFNQSVQQSAQDPAVRNGGPVGFAKAWQDAHQAAANAGNTAQANEGGVNTSEQSTSAGGIQGFFGVKQDAHQYTAQNVADTTTDANKQMIAGQMTGLQGQVAPQATATQAGHVAINQAPQDQFRQQQMGLAAALTNQMNGTGPSAAQAQLQAGTDASINSALALARSVRGGNQSVAMKNALMQNGQTMQSAANAATQLRAQEVQQAQQGLAGVLAQGRASDIGLATDQAGLTQQTNLANAAAQTDVSKANAELKAQFEQQKNALLAQYTQGLISLDQYHQQLQIQQNQFNAGLLAQQEAARQGVSIQNQAQAMQTAGAVIGAVGAAASDERMKKNIGDGRDRLDKFLDSIGAHEYEYKDKDAPFAGAGVFVSPMAQELERTDLGKHLVVENEKGNKIVDYGKGFGLMMAIAKMNHDDIKKLKERS